MAYAPCFTQRQRDMLLELATTPPGRWARYPRTALPTAYSLKRRGLVAVRDTDDREQPAEVRLLHNDAARIAPGAGTAAAPDYVGFARAVLRGWPECEKDSFDLQSLAFRFSLLHPETRTEPCSDNCRCLEYYGRDDMAEGVLCYGWADGGGA